MRTTIALLLALALAITAPSAAAAPSKQEVRRAQEELSEVKQRRATTLAELRELSAQLAALRAEVGQLQAELAGAEEQLRAIERQLAETNGRLIRGEQVLAAARQRLREHRERFARRARRALQFGEAGYVDFLLRADSAGELTRSVDFVRLLVHEDRRRLERLAALERREHEAMMALVALRDEQAAARDATTAERERVAEILAEQRAAQETLAADQERYEQLMATLDARQREATRVLAAANPAKVNRYHPVPRVRGRPAHGVVNRRDGVHIWLRYYSPRQLYIVSVNRRDAGLRIAKKTPGGSQNGGTYHVLAFEPAGTYPIPFDAWQQVRAEAFNRADGAVELRLWIGGTLRLSAVDDGRVGGPPLRAAGRVGIRGDNTEFLFDDVVVHPLDRRGRDTGARLLDDFDGYRDGLLTGAHPRSPRSRRWRMTSGTLFVNRGRAWTGKPDYGWLSPRPSTRQGNWSAVFRLRTRSDDFRDVGVALRLRTRGMVHGR